MIYFLDPVGGLGVHSQTRQRLQSPFIKEYALNHIRDPAIIYRIFLLLVRDIGVAGFKPSIRL